MPTTSAAVIISTILKHDRKITSYKIALLRAINDVVLSYPELGTHFHNQAVAVPLRVLAAHWLSYYWSFCDPLAPIFQGQRANRTTTTNSTPLNPTPAAAATTGALLGQDMELRPHLTALRLEWAKALGNNNPTKPADGFFLVSEMRLPRKRSGYPPALLEAYERTIKTISKTIENPIQYAGPGQWTIFSKPVRYSQLLLQLNSQSGAGVVAIPDTLPEDKCLLISAELWQTFLEMSLWVEALCLHEWCLFTERVEQTFGVVADDDATTSSGSGSSKVDRGTVYRLLTDRPDNRRPLTWERNHIDVLLLEGRRFTCPWTQKSIYSGVKYDLDHLLPLAVYPTNELWNLVPADPNFNSHIKRDRLPSSSRLATAIPHLVLAYTNYASSKSLKVAIEEDATIRFASMQPSSSSSIVGGVSGVSNSSAFPQNLAVAVTNFITEVTQARNIALF